MENSLAKMRPELVTEWSSRNLPLTPDEVSYGSNKLYWWHGPCGHEWQTSAKARSNGENCPICSNARIIPGINDLKTLAPELSKEWSEKNAPLEPTMIGPGSHKKVMWHGKCGHEWSAPIRNRVRGAGCPYCSHNIVLPGFNDLQTIHPEVAKEWSSKNLPLLPSQVTAYSNKKMWWKWLVYGVIGGVALLGVFYLVGDKIDFMRSGTWGHRLQAWLHPNPDELSQENMARMAIARGGLFGNGIGTTIHGRLMTQAHNDFIFAIIIEEAGTFAATIILALYAWFYFRCIRIATSCPGTFGSVFVAGMGTLILLQAIINMLVATGVFPVTGQTLPFISHGGSSFLFLGVGMGLIQSVAADNKRRERLAKKQAAEEEALETSEAETVAQPAV